MKTYELTYIISSAQTSEESETTKKDIEAFLQGKGGNIVKSKKTTPQSLAYPIRKQHSGYFVTLEFQAEESEIKALGHTLAQNPNILRYSITVKKTQKLAKETRSTTFMAGKMKSKPEFSRVYKENKKESLNFDKDKTDKTPKVELQDIDKKLDEILSE